jgi:hypothetical protein
MSEPANKKHFVVIKPYQYDGDVAFGFWNSSFKAYELGDGDCYTIDQLKESWSDAKFLSWTEMENKFK